MRRLIRWILILALLVIVVATVLYFYIKPAEEYDLKAEPLDLYNQISEMVRKQRLEVALDEQELNQVIKLKLAEQAQVNEDVVITGAHFTMKEQQLHADIQFTYKDRFKLSVQITYLIQWDEPYLILVTDEIRVKDFVLRKAWLPMPNRIWVDMRQYMPRFVGVRDIVIEDAELKIYLNVKLP